MEGRRRLGPAHRQGASAFCILASGICGLAFKANSKMSEARAHSVCAPCACAPLVTAGGPSRTVHRTVHPIAHTPPIDERVCSPAVGVAPPERSGTMIVMLMGHGTAPSASLSFNANMSTNVNSHRPATAAGHGPRSAPKRTVTDGIRSCRTGVRMRSAAAGRFRTGRAGVRRGGVAARPPRRPRPRGPNPAKVGA
jgi:hypothetical protein